MHYVYMLHSDRLGKYYVGRTENISKRLEDHNAGRSTYTKRGRPWALVYEESFEEKADAVAREKEIEKRKSRRYIEKLVQSVPSCP